MAYRTVIAAPAPEKQTYRLTGVLRDETGAAIAAASLTTLTLTLYALDASLSIINSVTAVNILNTGRGTVDANGNLVITLLPADMALVSATSRLEAHVALIRWTYAAGVKSGAHEIEFVVENLHKIT